MAFCGVSFSDEKKEDTEADYHSVKNVAGFSTVNKHFGHNYAEGLLDIDEKGKCNDRREKIDFGFEKFKLLSFITLQQVKLKVRKGVQGVGTGTDIWVDGVGHILTCAHNSVSKSVFTGRFVGHKDGSAYQMRQGDEAWYQLNKLDPKNIRVHPDFNGEPSCGFDIAMCAYSPEKHEYNRKVKYDGCKNDSTWGSVNPKDIEIGYKVEVAGYPAEKEGWAYYHRGEIRGVKETEEGGWIVFYKVDSSPGMSGSPIQIMDQRYLSKHLSEKSKSAGIKKMIIGVHTGHDITTGMNFGTLLTPALRKWIENN